MLISQPVVRPGDITMNGVVDVSDMLAMLGAWGSCPETEPCFPVECPADLNGDGVVDTSDLLMLLDDWGKCPGFPDPAEEPLTIQQTMTERV